MRLDSRAFGVAAGSVAAILYLICAVAVLVAPGPTTLVASYLIHMDLSTMPRVLTAGSFLVGLAVWTLGTAVVFASVAGIYNTLLRGLADVPVDVARKASQTA
jgi:hypothetical protein